MAGDGSWKNCIVREGNAQIADIVDNPKNWRIHDEYQRAVMADILDEVGIISQVIINEQTGYLIDGHMRVMLARENGEDTIPAVFVDLPADAEAQALLTHDTVGDMAFKDQEAYAGLLESVETARASLNSFLGLTSDAAEATDELMDEETEEQAARYEPIAFLPVRLGENWNYEVPRRAFENWHAELQETIGHQEGAIEDELISRLRITM